MFEIERFEYLVPTINTSRQYWFIRTNGGEYYDDFFKGGFVAIGFDKVLLYDLVQARNTAQGLEQITASIRKNYPDHTRPQASAKMLIRFIDDIKKGDIIVIPSEGSRHVAFGEVLESTTYLKNESKDIDSCPFEKRKKVKWLKSISRYKLNPNLYQLFFSHHALTGANQYADYIDKTLNSFFVKLGKAHLVLDVTTREGIPARDLFSMGTSLLNLVENYGEEHQEDLSVDDIEIKTNLESPGTVELISQSVLGLMVIGNWS